MLCVNNLFLSMRKKCWTPTKGLYKTTECRFFLSDSFVKHVLWLTELPPTSVWSVGIVLFEWRTMNGVTWYKPHAVWIMLYHILTSEFGLAHAPCILDVSFSVKYCTIPRYIPKRCNLITTLSAQNLNPAKFRKPLKLIQTPSVVCFCRQF